MVLPELICAAYTMLGTELEKVRLLNRYWQPTKPKDASAEDRELVDIFLKVERLTLREHGAHWTEHHAAKFNDLIQKLPRRDQEINTTLMALHFIRAWAEENIGPMAILLKDKTNRLIDKVAGEVQAHSGLEVRRNTWRRADDFIRLFSGRLALPDEVRDARFRRR